MGLTDAIKTRAQELGFARVGIARVEPLEPEAQRLREYIQAGRHASMKWLADTADVRVDPAHPGMVKGARSVVVLAMPFASREPRAGLEPGRIARYAWGRDYHNVLRRPLRKLEAMLREHGFDARWSVDARPVYERAWAQRAGIGFVGKNCCLIVPGIGSHVFLATVVTTAELEPDAPMAPRCGECRLCLDACPTDAFVDAHQLDSNRCISYLTIEHEGEIEPELESRMDDWLFGCDVCQDVCPYNKTAPPDRPDAFAPHARLTEPLTKLFEMDEDEFRAWAEGSPMRRAGLERMQRNARIVLANGKRQLPVLQNPTAIPRTESEE